MTALIWAGKLVLSVASLLATMMLIALAIKGIYWFFTGEWL